MTERNVFLKNLADFEPVLNRFDYFRNEYEEPKLATSVDNWSVLFINMRLSRKVYMDFTLTQDGIVLISFTMYKIPKEKTFFSLFDFLKNHNLEDEISHKLEPGGDLDKFCQDYFKSLGNLFENELNDQITGKTFENHWQALMDSMNDY